MFKAKLLRGLNINELEIKGISEVNLSKDMEFELYSSETSEKGQRVIIMAPLYVSVPNDAIKVIEVKGKMEE